MYLPFSKLTPFHEHERYAFCAAQKQNGRKTTRRMSAQANRAVKPAGTATINGPQLQCDRH